MNSLKKLAPRVFSTRSTLDFEFSSKQLLILMIVVVITTAIDSEIGFIADFIPSQLSSNWGFAVFISIAIVFAITQYFLLAYVRQINKDTIARALHLDLTHSVVSIAQFILDGILAIVILQVLTLQQYNIAALFASYAISYGLWIVTLGLLAKAFTPGIGCQVKTLSF